MLMQHEYLCDVCIQFTSAIAPPPAPPPAATCCRPPFARLRPSGPPACIARCLRSAPRPARTWRKPPARHPRAGRTDAPAPARCGSPSIGEALPPSNQSVGDAGEGRRSSKVRTLLAVSRFLFLFSLPLHRRHVEGTHGYGGLVVSSCYTFPSLRQVLQLRFQIDFVLPLCVPLLPTFCLLLNF